MYTRQRFTYPKTAQPFTSQPGVNMLGQSFTPNGRASVSPVAAEILRQWPLVDSQSQRLALVVNPYNWRVILTPQHIAPVNSSTRVSSAFYPSGAPSRKSAKNIARNLLKSLRSVSKGAEG